MRPKSSGQKRYVDAIRHNVITFGIGPAGTGKSWLAVAMAVQALQSKEVDRIILTRPAVEAGERLGFLPGDLMAKVDPYLRPLYDALYDMVEPEGAQRLLDRGTVEVAPLAFMRGRTLNASFIILDEAQNTSPEQMKMFLTRIGFGSKVVVTGDITQVDVPAGAAAWSVSSRCSSGIDGLAFVHLTSRDVVRHRIVQDIVDAYERGRGRPAARLSPMRPGCRAHRPTEPSPGRCVVTVEDVQDDWPVDAGPVARAGALARAGADWACRPTPSCRSAFVDRTDDGRAQHSRTWATTARPTCSSFPLDDDASTGRAGHRPTGPSDRADRTTAAAR